MDHLDHTLNSEDPQRGALENRSDAGAPFTPTPQIAATLGASSTSVGEPTTIEASVQSLPSLPSLSSLPSAPKTTFSPQPPRWLMPTGETTHGEPLLEPQEPQTRVDRSASARLAERINAQPNECYRNAALALFAPFVPANSWYVEGTVAMLDVSLPLEHGWIELSDGTLLDPTFFRERSQASPADEADVPDEAQVFLYYAGIRYSREQIVAAVHSHTGFPLVAHGPTPWFTHDGYRNAYQAALARVLSQRSRFGWPGDTAPSGED